jgi:hypothetical protein
MAMDELAERIRASIENPDVEPWFPELTDALAARAWESLERDIGLTPDSYGTERVLSGSLSTPREIIASLKTCPSTCATPSAIAIEALTQSLEVKYQEQGVTFYSAEEILHSTILSCLEDALAIINQVPSLMRTVALLVRSLHVIKPADDDYDVSFSEPDVPFSIFVSVPERRIANDALRVAEAIVHEATHLQLTFFETHLPFVTSSARQYLSPWRGEFRPASSILHGLDVFVSIEEFLGRLKLSSSADAQSEQYAVHRRTEILDQIGRLQLFERAEELTKTGRRFVEGLIDSARKDVACAFT